MFIFYYQYLRFRIFVLPEKYQTSLVAETKRQWLSLFVYGKGHLLLEKIDLGNVVWLLHLYWSFFSIAEYLKRSNETPTTI